jgi:hypothetical protein
VISITTTGLHKFQTTLSYNKTLSEQTNINVRNIKHNVTEPGNFNGKFVLIWSLLTKNITTEQRPSKLLIVASRVKKLRFQILGVQWPVALILRATKVIHTITHQIFKTHFEIKMPITFIFPNWSTPLRFLSCSYVCILYSTVRGTCSAHLILLSVISLILIYKTNSMVWVRERTIPTERPPLVGEMIAKFCG